MSKLTRWIAVASVLAAALLAVGPAVADSPAVSPPRPVEGIRIEGNTITVNPAYWSFVVRGGTLDLTWKKPKPKPTDGYLCTCDSRPNSCSFHVLQPGGDQAECRGSCSGGSCELGMIMGTPVEPQ